MHNSFRNCCSRFVAAVACSHGSEETVILNDFYQSEIDDFTKGRTRSSTRKRIKMETMDGNQSTDKIERLVVVR
ncbi:MAG: hypothetical protein WD266_00480 [Balneolales bacterium]